MNSHLTSIKEGIVTFAKLMLALAVLVVWVPLWAAKKVLLLFIILGLVVPLLPSVFVTETLATSPIAAKAAPGIAWFVEHSFRICLILLLFQVWLQKRSIDEIHESQGSQDRILGGLIKYLNVHDFRFAPAIEEATKANGMWQFTCRLAKQYAINAVARLWVGKSGWKFVAGLDPFDTAFKRNDRVITLREDLQQVLRETKPQDK